MTFGKRVKIVGGFSDGRRLTGIGIRVLLETEDGEEVLIPALSLKLTCGGAREAVIATIEVPAHLVQVEGVELRTEAVVASGGPESQWEDSLGKRPGEPLASVEQYAEPHRDAWHRNQPVVEVAARLRDQIMEEKIREDMKPSDRDVLDAVATSKFVEVATSYIKERMADGATKFTDYLKKSDPLDDLDKVITAGGDVSAVLPKDEDG